MERVLNKTKEVVSCGTSAVDDDTLSCETSEDEIWAAIKQLKNGKSPGKDMI